MSFDGVPSNYRKSARPTWHQRRRHAAVLHLMKGIGGRVLDYGCGYGDLAYAISRTNPVVGCDVDPRRVAFASQEYAPIVFVQCDQSGAPFADHSFDVVLSVVVIHFVPDPAHYLAEIQRLLKPDGTLVFFCQNRPVFRDTLRRLFRRGQSPSPIWIPSMSEMKSIIARAGFEIVDSTFFYDPPFDGWKNTRDWCAGTLEQLSSLLNLRSVAAYYGYRTRLVKDSG